MNLAIWKAYTPEQIAGTEKFPPIRGIHEMAGLMQWYDPIDTTNPRLIKLAKELGHPIDAVEFTNEPNVMDVTGFTPGYRPEHFRRDQDLFHKWVRENHPGTLIVGPCTTDGNALEMGPDDAKGGAGIADVMYSCSAGFVGGACSCWYYGKPYGRFW